MGELKNIGKETGKLILGRDGSDKEPDDFKTELDRAVKKEKITKADGTLLITARENVDNLGKKIDKEQLNYIKKLANNQSDDADSEYSNGVIKEKPKRKKQAPKGKKQKKIDDEENGITYINKDKKTKDDKEKIR